MIIHGLTFDQYRALPGWNASTAVHALDAMRLVRDIMDGLDDDGESPALQIGTIAHMAILEPDRFDMCRRTRGPINERTGEPYGRDTKAFRDWQAANPDWIAVPEWIGRAIERMPDEVRALVAGPHGFSESTAHTQCGDSWVKCRPDRLDSDMCADLKTINDIRGIERDINKRFYWFTAAWYRMVLKLATQRKHTHCFVFVEKRLPNRWRIVDLDADLTMYADDQADRVLGRLMEAEQTGDWSDSGDVRVMVGRPAHLIDEDEGDDA